jgi:hypothetical protein
MATFADLLSSVQTQLNQNNPKGALDMIFGEGRLSMKDFDPTKQETKDFIDLFRKAIETEKKTFFVDRAAALNSVSSYNLDPGAPQFTGVKPPKFAFQLALRVREPNMISQGELGLCGANAAVIHFAKTNPRGYAQLGIDLMKKGTGMFGQNKVEPGSSIKSGVAKLNLFEADYVVLASVRGSSSLLDKITGNSKEGIGEGMDAGDVCKLLKQSGYTDVEDHCHTFTSTNWKENLKKAALNVSLGRLVMFSINAKLVTAMKNDKLIQAAQMPFASEQEALARSAVIRDAGSGTISPKKLSSTSADHWVLVSKLVVTDNEVTVKLYSWGYSVKRTMDLKTFLSYYGGFVCAKLGGEAIPEVPPQ